MRKLICIYQAELFKMYFIRIESFVFLDLSHCANTLPAEIELFISVILFCGWNYRQF